MALPVFLVDTADTAPFGDTVFGLGDALADAPVLGRPLASWQSGAQDAADPIQGPAFVVGRDLWVSDALLRALSMAGAEQKNVVRLARAQDGPGALGDPLERLPRDDDGRILFDVYFVPPDVTFDPHEADARTKATGLDVTARTRTFILPADPEVTGKDTLTLSFSGAACCPVSHWAELLRANLLALGSGALSRPSWGRLFRYLWAALKSGSLAREKVMPRLNRVGVGCEIHESAVVEGCALGDFVEVGAGAVLKGCVIGDRVRIGPQALCELSSIGDDARIQRRAMVTASVVLEHARVGGILQFGLQGKKSATKMFAVGTDMRLDGRARVVVPDGDTTRLAEVDIGYIGICVGHEAFVGSGVWVGPGRVVPAGTRIGRARDQVWLKPD